MDKDMREVNEKCLFFGLIIIFLPILLTSSFQTGSIIYTMGIMLVFMLQTLMLLYMFRKGIMQFRAHRVAYTILILFIVSQICVLLFFNDTNYLKELTNIVAIMLNGIIIIGATNYKITIIQLKNFMMWYVQFSIAACIYNLLNNYSIIVKVVLGLNDEYVQISSFLPNRNTFGFLLVCAIFAIFVLMDIKYENWHLFILLFFDFELILTMSRTSIVAVSILFIIEILYLCLSKEYSIRRIANKVCSSIKSIKKQVVLVLTLIILFSISLCSIYFNTDVSGNSLQSQIIRSEDVSNASGRIGLWQMAISIWKENPLFGVGRFHAVSVLEQSGSDLNQFHNAYIEALVSHGIFGLLLFLALFLYILIKIMRSNLNNKFKITMLAFYLSIGFQSLLETRVRFSCGLVDTFTVFFIVLIPLLLSNGFSGKNGEKCIKDFSYDKSNNATKNM